jgi:hypothetical protein
MTMKRLSLLALCMLLLPACRSAPLLNPDPFKAAATPEKTKKAIEMALAGRGWLISKEEPGKIAATLNTRKHTARILITYDDEYITIKYVDSQNLNYDIDKNGQVVIHENYNSWIRYLMQDINRNIMLNA